MRPVMGCPCGRKSIGAQPSGGIGHRVGWDHVTSDRNTGPTCLSNVSGQVGAHGRGNKPRVTHPRLADAAQGILDFASAPLGIASSCGKYEWQRMDLERTCTARFE